MSILRRLAHLYGWHLNVCRGDSRCIPADHGRLTRWGWYT